MLRLVALGQLVLGLELLPRPRPAAAERIEETKKAWSPDSADEAVRERAKAMDAKIVASRRHLVETPLSEFVQPIDRLQLAADRMPGASPSMVRTVGSAIAPSAMPICRWRWRHT